MTDLIEEAEKYLESQSEYSIMPVTNDLIRALVDRLKAADETLFFINRNSYLNDISFEALEKYEAKYKGKCVKESDDDKL